MPTGGHTTRLNPDACQTAIDAVLYSNFEREEVPAYLSSRNDMFFNQGTTDSIAFLWDEDSNVGAFQATDEQEEILTENTFIGNQKSKRVTKYTKSIPVSWEAFKTDQVGKRDRIGSQMGDRARLTQDKLAIQTTYGDAFSGTFNTTPDAANLASNSHTTLKGFTVDNLETGVLNPDNLWTCTVSLGNQLAQDGELGGHLFGGWLGPLVLYKTAKEVMNSNLIANSAENNLNIFETDFGEVAIKQSQYLGSAYNNVSNANTSYHLISKGHQIMRKVLSDVSTDLIDPTKSRSDSWEYRARYAESTFPGTWEGYLGCSGSAAS
jgi:hypothetical protein